MGRFYDVELYEGGNWGRDCKLFKDVEFACEPRTGETIIMPPLEIKSGDSSNKMGLKGKLNAITHYPSVDGETEPRTVLIVKGDDELWKNRLEHYFEAFQKLDRSKIKFI